MSDYIYTNGQLHTSDELQHYGVLGMKWGVRHARKKQAKQVYKKATDKAFEKYEHDINKIEKGYKRGQNLSKKDAARELAIENRYRQSVKKAARDYNKAKTDRSNDAAIANKLYSKQSKEANKRVTSMSTGEAIVQSMFMGSYGALKFNEAKAAGASTGRAAVKAILYNAGDAYVGGLMSTGKYIDNRLARHK